MKKPLKPLTLKSLIYQKGKKKEKKKNQKH